MNQILVDVTKLGKSDKHIICQRGTVTSVHTGDVSRFSYSLPVGIVPIGYALSSVSGKLVLERNEVKLNPTAVFLCSLTFSPSHSTSLMVNLT